MARKKKQNELIGFLVIWAVRYAKDYGLNGLHPTHYDLMVKHGARMVDFKRATNVREFAADVGMDAADSAMSPAHRVTATE